MRIRPVLVLVIAVAMAIGGDPSAPADGAAITHGPLSGEVTATSVVLWARAAGPGTIEFTVSDASDVAGPEHTVSVEVRAASDFTGKVVVDGLLPRTDYYYAATFIAGGERGERVLGQFTTPPDPTVETQLRFTLGSCLGGQQRCRPPTTGWEIFARMAALAPDFYVMLGDGIYADDPCPSAAGENVPGAEEVAQDLAGYRQRYRYHLEDEHYRAFLARTPVYATWDDHEIRNNFGGPELRAVHPQLFDDGRQAFFEYWPLAGSDADPYRMYRSFSRGAHAEFFILDSRSYRDPIVHWDTHPLTGTPKSMLGREQFAWLQRALVGSPATWKFIVTSVPLSIPTGAERASEEGRDGWADGGGPTGYETELMSLLYFIAAQRIDNVVFLTGDTHYPFVHSYDPDRDGEPDFHEFAASPLHASVSSPAPPDQTFNPTVLFAGDSVQNFGMIDVTAAGGLTFASLDDQGNELFAVTLTPR
jgi:alkaline phosphatase D